jgi:predicted acyltransferase
MTNPSMPRAAARLSPLGLVLLVITSVGWGLNFPIMKGFRESPRWRLRSAALRR